MYHACDIFFLLLYTMRGRPFVAIQPPGSLLWLWALPSAF